MTTEIDNFEYEFNGTLIVLKIYCEDKAKQGYKLGGSWEKGSLQDFFFDIFDIG